MGEWRGVCACGNESCDVRDVGQEICAYLVRNFPKLFEIKHSWIGRCASDDNLRLLFFRNGLHFFEINKSITAERILRRLVELCGEIHFPSVRKVAAERQAHSHDLFTGLEEC